MSVDINVFIGAGRMPFALHWGQAIRDAGFELELDPAFDPARDDGFVPCRYRGEEAGFEFSRAILSGELERYGIGDPSRPLCLTFSTRGRYRDLAASTISAAVLCAMCDGVLRDADGKELIPAARAIAWARDGEAEIQADIAKERTLPEAPPQIPPQPPKTMKWRVVVTALVVLYLGLSLFNLYGTRRPPAAQIDAPVPSDLSRDVRERLAR